MLGRSRWEWNTPGFSPSLGLWRLAGTVPCTKKVRAKAYNAILARLQVPGSGACLYTTFPRLIPVPGPVASCRHRSVHEKSPSQGIQRDSCAIAGAWVRSLPLYYIPPAYPRPWACGVLPAPFRARKKSEPRHTTRFLRDCRCLGPELAFILHSPG